MQPGLIESSNHLYLDHWSKGFCWRCPPGPNGPIGMQIPEDDAQRAVEIWEALEPEDLPKWAAMSSSIDENKDFLVTWVAREVLKNAPV
jgi:hypothetical protein